MANTTDHSSENMTASFTDAKQERTITTANYLMGGTGGGTVEYPSEGVAYPTHLPEATGD